MRCLSTFSIIIAAAMTLTAAAPAKDLTLLRSLEGEWKLELGDSSRWREPDYDDSRWARVRVPSAWEDQGFPGYDGYAWYRLEFEVPAGWKDETLFLRLGHIDDADEVYVNGRFLGFQGSFPPHYVTAYDVPREYYLPWEFLRPGRNVLAVRVYDNELSGGIIHAGYQRMIGIYADPAMIRAEYLLSGTWKLMPGDRDVWSSPSYDDSDWQDVFVPAYWETQGFRGLDGFAWYRMRFRLPPALAGQTLVLLLGKIDDADQTFLNGTQIGKTGRMPPEQFRIGTEEYLDIRAYTLPASVLSETGENLLAVRVFDGFLHGGIYSVPVGITTRERYLAWSKKRARPDRVPWFVDWIRAFFDR